MVPGWDGEVKGGRGRGGGGGKEGKSKKTVLLS